MPLRLFTLVLFVCLSTFSQATPPAPIEWLVPETHDFGDVLRNQPVSYEFTYRNNTDTPLLIDNVRTSCGCTTSEWQAQPVPPDSIGVLRVEYDARSDGYFRKYLKVYFNGYRKAKKLWVEGYVE
ncbi:MAG: DUF1573 domain-containing protein [Bacteroidota bacterium]